MHEKSSKTQTQDSIEISHANARSRKMANWHIRSYKHKIQSRKSFLASELGGRMLASTSREEREERNDETESDSSSSCRLRKDVEIEQSHVFVK